MGINTGWWLCTAQLYLQAYDVALWLRFLLFDSHSCFLPDCLLTAVPGPVPLAGRIHHNGMLPLPPWSDPFPPHATQSMMPELPFQNLKWFNVAYKMSSIQLHVKWGKYASTENWPRKSSTERIFFLKHWLYCTQGKHKWVPASHFLRCVSSSHWAPEFLQGTRHSNRWRKEKKRSETSGVTFTPKTITGVDFA